MPMCSRTDARCYETGCFITEMYKCPWECLSGSCDTCEDCYVEDENGTAIFINED